MKSGHRSFSPLTLLQHVEFDPAHTFFPTCSDFWLDFAPVVRMACERKFLESEATTGFFLLLGKQGNKAVLDWVMKEGLIPSKYECPKCKKDMRLVERKGTIDGFEWGCRVQSKENPHFVCRSIRKDDQSVIMEEIDPQNITDEQKCNNLKSIDKQIKIFTARKDYIRTMLNIEKSIPGPTNETFQKLEAEAAGLEEKIRALEGNMLEFLPCPVPLCAHNFKYNKNNKKRTAEPIIRPSKLTAKINENKLDDEDFKIPLKTAKSNTVPKKNIKINSKNKFAALNTANDDVEDVTPAAPKVKPVMMKLFPEYNLILQEIHRTNPIHRTPIPISVGILRSKRNLPTTTEKLPNFSLTRELSTTLLTPLQIDHSRWSLKASWPPPSPKKLKKTLLIKVSKLKKSRSCANLKQKVPFPSS
ncbi:uncharacterized protein TNCV_4778941 [Trichonephila clavipes]|nr:uncharacterized protein TNCV_4778941 [Trichonephila clavipes]